ncbi:hypothetical protein OEZ85_011591 [Tetradesmus obliquus]|uniref:Uncharacterized protein n=1 Tax=Tetradesmus obliquus TaxID=3088 RepID=A0ABY8TT42_TETOB|nr:hypothetical protein OEZ85_011591 [Tetradesmus obliquus]
MDENTRPEDVLSQEILRKLKLATEAETKEDREIICEEVFCDITGQLDFIAKERLHVNHSGPVCFYEVLAPYYCQNNVAADTLLYFCKRLWGLPYLAPTFALLLHRWLLLRREAGGIEQRQKHVNVLMYGSRQLFLGDVQSGIKKFAALFGFLSQGVVLSPNRQHLDQLPAQARETLLAVVAAYTPYYTPPAAVKQVLEEFPSPLHTLAEGGHMPGEGADFLLGEVTDTISRVRTEQGLLTYLHCLKALGGAHHLKSLKAITRLRLQSELYSLTSPGGPYYAPRSVRSAALEVLDALFPMGRRSRRLVRLVFRILHPAEILGVVFFVLLLPVRVWSWASRKALGGVAWAVMGVLRLFGLLRLLGWHGAAAGGGKAPQVGQAARGRAPRGHGALQ